MNIELLAKAQAYKNKVDKLRPLSKDFLKMIRQYYRIGLTYTSTALEGNGLTESETKIVLEDGLTVAGKPLKDIYEVVGHAKAYDFMFSLINKKGIEKADVFEIHNLVYGGIEKGRAGVYRDEPAIITGSKYPTTPAGKIESQMNAFYDWYCKNEGKMNTIEFVTEVHKRFVFIHPFADGNGRTARLLSNLALLRDGYTIMIIPPVVRHDYITCLERAHVDDRDLKNFICERVVETQKDLLKLLQEKTSLSESELSQAKREVIKAATKEEHEEER